MPPGFYAVTVTNSASRQRGTSLCWSAQFSRIADAKSFGHKEVDEGRATLAFVVRIENGVKEALSSYVYPTSARRIIEHWKELKGECDGA